jgi:hypothetical protein
MKWRTNLFAVGLVPRATVGVVPDKFLNSVEESLVGIGLIDANSDFVGHLVNGHHADKGSGKGERTM